MNGREEVENSFTSAEYRLLARLCVDRFRTVAFTEWESWEEFALWRHDCDFSLNRSLQLARIDQEEGLKSTFFVNIHSEFYNCLEKSQSKILEEITQLGHDIGIHLDMDFYDHPSEASLDGILAGESSFFRNFLGIRPQVFSFHNPSSQDLLYDRKSYGGLVNAYSSTLKESCHYCSDSNGFWRYRSLREVLTDPSVRRLHCLTHDAWWQETEMPPRQRVIRSIFGRAAASVSWYENRLLSDERVDASGATGELYSSGLVPGEICNAVEILSGLDREEAALSLLATFRDQLLLSVVLKSGSERNAGEAFIRGLAPSACDSDEESSLGAPMRDRDTPDPQLSVRAGKRERSQRKRIFENGIRQLMYEIEMAQGRLKS